MGYRAETLSELLVPIRVILAEIPRETLNIVFLEWMERLPKCVQVDCEYELKERNILKLILIVRFPCATLELGHPIFCSVRIEMEDRITFWTRQAVRPCSIIKSHF
jgi:hypothetical protein